MFDRGGRDPVIADLLLARLELARTGRVTPSRELLHGRQTIADNTPDASRGGWTTLVELAHGIELFLPWRDRRTNTPVSMRVIGVGLLERQHRLFAIGTPYVRLAVDSWAAAEAVHQALAPVAGLDEVAWAIDWWQSAHGFREIKIFPDPAELARAVSLSSEPDL